MTRPDPRTAGADAPLLAPSAVRGLRGGRPALSPDRPQGILVEEEREGGRRRSSATLFLTGTECPFTCVFCDLWRHTLGEAPTPPGALPTQVSRALAELAGRGCEPEILKLYNASNLFDPRAVPTCDDDALLELVDGRHRVVVECHPAFLRGRGEQRCRRWASALPLEVALGLETVAPDGLAQLGKGADLDAFAAAIDSLLEMGATVRVFVLFGIPRRRPSEASDGSAQRRWTLDTLRWARCRGARCATVIPVRGGNGALEELRGSGCWVPPTLADFEGLAEEAMLLGDDRFDVHLDLWDLERLPSSDDAVTAEVRCRRLRAMERSGGAHRA